MSHEALVVVGDQFDEFLANRATVGVSALLARLRSDDLPSPLHLCVGQGLTREQLAELGRLVERAGGSLVLRHGSVPVHTENTMIGPVERVAADRFSAPLLLDQRVEILDDHLSGQHIPAVTLIEAARQAWTVVTERFLLDAEQRTRLVISEISEIRSSFHRYMFPLPATVECRLVDHATSPAGETFAFAFAVAIHQNEALAAEIEARIRVLPKILAKKQESLAARQALHDELARLKPTLDRSAP